MKRLFFRPGRQARAQRLMPRSAYADGYLRPEVPKYCKNDTTLTGTHVSVTSHKLSSTQIIIPRMLNYGAILKLRLRATLDFEVYETPLLSSGAKAT